jgi:hypothetical protein
MEEVVSVLYDVSCQGMPLGVVHCPSAGLLCHQSLVNSSGRDSATRHLRRLLRLCYLCDDNARKELWRVVDVGAVSPCAW